MNGRRARLAGGLVVASATLLAVGEAAALATPRHDSGDSAGFWAIVSFVVVVAAFSLVGGVISLRRPDSAIGWLLATVGLLFAVVVACSSVSEWALKTHGLPTATGEWISVGGTAWVPALALIGTQLPLRLPDGRLPSPSWRWFSRATIGLTAVSLVGMAVQPGRVAGIAGTANPVGSEALKPLSTVFLLVIFSFVGGLAALVVRYRRAAAHERVQLRWIALGGGVFLGVYLVTLPLAGVLGLREDSAASVLITSVAQVTFAALPIAIGYAVLKHRLYDIDVVVNRTLVYGALTATLAATYLGSVLLLQLLLNGVTSDSNLAVAGSTLAVAALFRPARARIQAAVDRRFYRRKYDARRTLDAFSSRLRDQVDLGTLTVELNAVVRETLQPAHVSVWLRGPGERP
jgi:hypothetical protein